MRKLFFLLILLSLPVFLYSQNSKQYEIGLPYIRNYSPKDYAAFSQNWGFVQDSRGVLYFANGDGVLEYDGVHWRLIKITNDYTATCLTVDKNNRIYVGSTSEFGYLASTKNGKLKYVSLINKLDKKDRKFNYLFNIYAVNSGIYFITGEKLFHWDNNKIKAWYVKKPNSCFKVDENILVWEKYTGIKAVKKDSLVNVIGGNFFSNIYIQNILKYKNNKVLIVTRDSGMYLMTNPFKLKKGQFPVITKFYNQAVNFIQINQLLHSTVLSNGYYAFSTLRGGTAIMDNNGTLVQVLDKNAGVQNETHNGVGQDNQNALWLYLDNGLTRADISSPLSFWNDDVGLKGSVLSITRFKGKIFAGTWQGLYYHNFSPDKYLISNENFETNISHFEPLKGIDNTTWDLLAVNNEHDRSKDKLLVATSGGVYEVDLYSAKLITSGVCTKLFRSEKNPSIIYIGTDDGIKCISINYIGDNLYFKNEKGINGIEEKIVNFDEDKEGKIWVATEFSGVYLLEKNKNKYIVKHFDETTGAPQNFCTIYKIKNKIVVITEDGIFFPVEKKKRDKSIEISFILDKSFLSKIQDNSTFINYLKEDKYENLWIQLTNKELGKKILLEANIKKDLSYTFKVNPFKQIPQMDVYSIFPEADNNVWFGGDDGIVKYDGNIKYEYDQEFHSLIRKVILERDSVIFWGTFFKNVNDSGECTGLDLIQPEELKPEISFAYNSITFEYAATSFYDETSKKYSIFLEGFDKKWSDWTSETKKEYTNLQPGVYKFHVIAKNIFEKQSTEAIYEFEILPPWYRTWLAYIFYFLCFSFIIFSIIRFSNKRLREAKIRLEELVKDRTSEINTQKKEIEIEKEKSDKLLLNILPFKIAQELKISGSAKTKFFEQATVLFSDFKDFTIIAQQLEPQELISELNRCFVFFDDVCVRHNIEKIKTVGDSYMCAGGIPMKNKTNPVDVVLAAFEMRDFISRLKKEQSAKSRTLWKIRIGINTGPIISGVVGKKKFAYDIWGDTVNTASRLEQTSLPNNINISGSTYELVKDFFDCAYRGKVPVKHKGVIDMYFVEKIKKELCVDDDGRIPNQEFWDLYEAMKN